MASGLCVPQQQAAHMAAPTEGQNVKKTIANGEPSTQGAMRRLGRADVVLVKVGTVKAKRTQPMPVLRR